ncbi:extracellular matrix regulator RemB [Desertibacillus haloalkaliphilus]|uniref:extracellular matrix regulator RemB n=1 Tax=Desertibacillus haloalkaliphilus TaxID=1328930 RepID=UPI001C263DBA|nr:DUF370 domain-containing protein [Desertibacillus haloalkaliphilus]MBU8905753.1 DUF370 domain-containing protein [Desertibacillus haloalkaliphilus]
MFIHLGGDTVIRSKDVVAILDSEMENTSSDTTDFLDAFRKSNQIIEISEDLTKSIVVTEEHVYFSPISSVTLKRRAQVISEFDSYADIDSQQE